MIKVGITGGIGSGKSLVASMLNMLGAPVYHSDTRAKWLMAHNPEVRQSLITLFGDEAFDTSGNIDRQYIASRVFGNTIELEALNKIVHPAVGRDYTQWLSKHNDVPYTLKEAALIFEAGIHKDLDFVVTVTAPEDVRIQRVVKRDGVSVDQVEARIRAQWSDAKRIPMSDFVLVNDGVRPVIRQVMELHKLLLKRARKSVE